MTIQQMPGVPRKYKHTNGNDYAGQLSYIVEKKVIV